MRQRAWILGMVLAMALGARSRRAGAQDQPPPAPPSPGLPTPGAGASPATLDAVLKRLNELEATNQRLLREVEQTRRLREDYQSLSEKYDELSNRFDKEGLGAEAGVGTRSGGGSLEGSSDTGGDTPETAPSGGGRQTRGPTQGAGLETGKVSLPDYYDLTSEGFKFEDEDKEFLLRFRGVLQMDAKWYEQAGQQPVDSGFYLPRVRFYFDGHVTKPVEYQLSLQRGNSSLDVLNAFLNLNYDERFQFRVGRFKTPFTYEFYKYNAYRLLMPERSLFAVNFAGNRQLGMMGWGEMFDQRLEYNVGVFDGPRNSYQDYNASKDVMSLINFKPFLLREGSILQNWNIGGSVDYGYQGQGPDRPDVLRTSVNASSANLASNSATNESGVPFLAFNPNVREQGMRQLWELHSALYYKGLSLLSAWDSGIESYAKNGAYPVSVPVSGYFVQAAYLVTGETLKGPAVIDPIHPFNLKAGKFGLGAFEPTARYSYLSLGNQVFTYGLADPNLWSNTASMVDVGLNWYLNKFVKIYFDWEHAMFGSPVYYAPGHWQKTSDMYWIRFQLYF